MNKTVLKLLGAVRESYDYVFIDLPPLGSVIDEKLWEHIYRCMELAHLDPAALVRALTIIEKNQHRKNRAAEVGAAAGAER